VLVNRALTKKERVLGQKLRKTHSFSRREKWLAEGGFPPSIGEKKGDLTFTRREEKPSFS